MGWTFYNASGQQLRNTGTVLATQAEMEAGSSIAAFVTPGRTQYHKGVAKAWVSVAADGTEGLSYNITCIDKSATGVYEVTIATDMATSDYAPFATVGATDFSDYGITVERRDDTLYYVRTRTGATTAADLYHYSGLFGNQ